MVQQLFSEELNQEIKAEKTYSQIFINITNSSRLLEEAKEIIEGLGVRIIEAKHLSPDWTLLKLDVKDIREIALKLTEHGFLIKGINALP
jgi:hypothetical protein